MKSIYRSLILLFFATSNILYSQNQVFTDTISVVHTFTSDTTINPFAGQTICGIAASGSVQFNSYTSYVRILISDNNGDQFIIFESYPMIDTIWNFNFNTKCDETCFLDNFQATGINFHVLDATVTLNNLEYTDAPVESADQLQYNAKLAKDLDKIDRANAFLESKQMLWRAGVTEYSNLYYNNRLDPYTGLAKYTYGFEYYIGGVFEIYGRSGNWNQPAYNTAPRFDWRSRHGADEENTPYFDGDLNGSGWMTDLRCQTGCWIENTEEWLCISEVECNQLGGEFIATGACTGFATISTVEGFANLYYNQHVDFDLSEQQLASPPMDPPFDNCGGVLSGGFVSDNYEIFVDYGVIGENDFLFRGEPVPCDQQQYPPEENVSLAGHQVISQALNPELLKKLLIEHGPITWTRLLPYAPNHALTLVGFDVLNVGDKYTIGYNQVIEVPARFSKTDVPIWILKDNYGINSRLDGYFYVILDQEGPDNVCFPENGVENAIMSLNYSDDDILIRDEDNDGYLNWGIGNCEECPGERDGDDHNASLGPMDENGFCTIIDSYSTSFEGKTYDNWRQVDGDSFDWLKHNTSVFGGGPDGAYDGDFYFVMEGVTNNPHDQTILESPTLELDDECLISLNFHYFRYYWDGSISTAPNLYVETSTDNGNTWTQVWSSNNPRNDPDWNEATVMLFSNVNKIRFIGELGDYPTQHNIGFDMITIAPHEQTGPLVISSDTWFGGEVFPCDDIIVESDVTLTLQNNCILHMPENSKILIKRRATMDVNGATITCDGPGQWKGIEVWGDNDLLSIPQLHQGYVRLRNSATIENASIGVLAGRDYESDDDQWEYSGGIVNVQNTQFINNSCNVFFEPYTIDDDNLSLFTNVTSVTNDDYAGTSQPGSMFVLKSKDILSITDISINDMRSNVPVTERPTGILTIDSDLLILTNNDPGTYTNTFTNLLYGIKSLQVNAVDNIDIENCGFYNCLRGIYSAGATGDKIIQCKFQPWENANPFVENYGIYLDECTGYVVEENLFENDVPSNRKGNGIVINNSGGDPNEIYRNTFVGLDYGIIAQNENRNRTGLNGLCLTCYDFDLCNNDIVITRETGNETPEQGIAAHQGADSPDPEDMAGNLFYIEDVKPDGDFDDINNQLSFITYYYPETATSEDLYRLVPRDYTKSTVTINKVLNNIWTFETGCPSNQSGGGGGSGDEEDLVANYNEATTKTDSLQNILNALVDAGDTYELTSEVLGSTPPESLEIYNELMSISPFVSDTVVSTAIQKEDVLPGAMVRDIMVANPNTAKSNKLMQQLDDRWDPLPDYMIAQILQGRSLVSLREKTEAILAHWKQQKNQATQALVSYYLADTINPQTSHTELETLLTSDDALHSKYVLAFVKLNAGDSNGGQNILNGISGSFNLTTSQQQTHQGMLAYYQWLVNAKADSLHVLQADSASTEQLHTMMNAGTGLPATYARNILLALDNIEYLEPVILPDPYKSARAEESYREKLEVKPPALITVKPNPAKDYLMLEYFPESDEQIRLEIRDTEGNLVHHLDVPGLHNEAIVDTRSWKPGLYVVSMQQNGKLIESTKFTLIN